MKGRTYRYMTQEPLYPFGYGLTYGDVSVERAQIVAKDVVSRDVTLQMDIVNRGNVETRDVVQVYVKDLESEFAVPNHSLCAFAKVSLKPGERQSIALQVPGEAFSAVNEDGWRVKDSGRYILFIGTGQPDTRTEVLTGNTCVKVEVEF